MGSRDNRAIFQTAWVKWGPAHLSPFTATFGVQLSLSLVGEVTLKLKTQMTDTFVKQRTQLASVFAWMESELETTPRSPREKSRDKIRVRIRRAGQTEELSQILEKRAGRVWSEVEWRTAHQFQPSASSHS